MCRSGVWIGVEGGRKEWVSGLGLGRQNPIYPRMVHPPLTASACPSGEHFGTLSTLSSGEKKRPFGAYTQRPCELAIISRVGYNRVLKKQLQVGGVGGAGGQGGKRVLGGRGGGA